MEFQEKLRSLRKERGETQAQVATAIGIGERHYQKFESGNNLPSFHNLCALADHFGEIGRASCRERVFLSV